jgi:hypothetical protein
MIWQKNVKYVGFSAFAQSIPSLSSGKSQIMRGDDAFSQNIGRALKDHCCS